MKPSDVDTIKKALAILIRMSVYESSDIEKTRLVSPRVLNDEIRELLKNLE